MKPNESPSLPISPGRPFLAGFLVLMSSLFLFAPTGWAQSGPPVVIVEDASESAPVAAFEYLTAGHEIELPGDATVVLGYLTSCRRETITGGRVTIGTEQSTISGGHIDHEQVPCDGGQIDLTQDAAAASGVIVFRGPEDADVTVYSSTPVFTFEAEANVSSMEIERLDRLEAVKRYSVTDHRVDLLGMNSPLNSGGVYEVRYGREARRFQIVVYARTGGPLVGRLIRL